MATTYEKLRCGHFTVVDSKLHFTGDVASPCRFWTEGVLSSAFAAFGLVGNAVSIWVLSVPEMRNSFNRLLMALAIIDCMFILPGIVIYSNKVGHVRQRLDCLLGALQCTFDLLRRLHSVCALGRHFTIRRSHLDL